MKILFCALKYEYGNPLAGFASIEYGAFYATLKRMPGIEVEYFPMDEIISQIGRDRMNKKLISEVEKKKPDLLFCILFTDQIKPETISYITDKTSTKTFNWFADDSWRFHIFSKYWAPLFTQIATTDPGAIAKYKALGINNVMSTQWAANPAVYHLPAMKKKVSGLGVTFVGAKYGNRGAYLEFLKNRGLPAEGFGNDWPNGRVSVDRMVEVFYSSRVNLNFTETPFMTSKERLRIFSRPFLKHEQNGWRLNFRNPLGYLRSAIDSQRRQFKARIFEVPACGGFLLTGKVEGLADYYNIGREILVFDGKKDLLEKCSYYMAHDDARVAIAKAGYERTIKDHTYEKRFEEIFKKMGLY